MADSIEIKWGTGQTFRKELDSMASKTPAITKDILKEAGDLLLMAIQKKAPKASGKYSKSWKIAKTSQTSVIIASPEGELFKILEYTGSQGGYREAVNAKALHWVDDSGKDVFVFSSNPKGFKNIPHLRPAIKQIKQILPYVISKNIGKHIPMFNNSSRDAAQRVAQFKQKVSA